MSDPPSPLLDPGRPPLNEVALTVQFEKIPDLLGPHVGLIWAESFRDDFPTVEERPPIEPVFELEHGPSRPQAPRVRLVTEPQLPRYFLIGASGTELIQLQNDRISYNWRMQNERYDYPRYDSIRGSFEHAFSILERFIEREKLGQIVPNQCELLYVNHILYSESHAPHRFLGELIDPWSADYRSLAEATLEEVQLQARHAVRDENGEFLGRLIVAVDPGYRMPDKTPLYRIQLLMRGAPSREDLSGSLEFLDLAHKKLGQAFSEFFSDTIQADWMEAHARKNRI